MARKQTPWDKFLLTVSSWFDWIWLIALSINIIWPGVSTTSTSYYPLNVLILSAFAVWLYHFNQKWISLLVIGVGIYLNWINYFGAFSP